MKLGLVAVLLVASMAMAAAQGTQTRFPYCACDRNVKDTRYELENQVTYSAEFGYCWTLHVGDCQRGGQYCCDADLRKFEFDVFQTCRSTKIQAFLNYKPTVTGAAFYNPEGAAPDRWTLRLTNLGLNQANAEGAVVCIKPISGACKDLVSLCVPNATPGVCGIALVSTDNKCCPVNYVGNQPPPPPPPSPPPPSPPPQCEICITLKKYRGVSALLCEELVEEGNSKAAEVGAIMAIPFFCKEINTTLSTVTACAYALNQGEAQKFYQNVVLDNGYFDFRDQFNVTTRSLVNGTCLSDSLAFDSPCFSYFQYEEACSPVDNEFPFCECRPGDNRLTPFNVTYLSRSVNSKGLNTYCFQVNVQPCTGRCCNMQLEKIEWLAAQPTCQQSVDGWTLNGGTYRAPSWSRSTDTDGKLWATFKTNQLNLSVAQANKAKICITLRNACPTLSSFCYNGAVNGCEYAIFDTAKSCCSYDLTEPVSARRRSYARLL